MTAPSRPPNATGRTVPDASPRNWVDRIAPAPWRPYLRLARFDRPIGAWLLLFPCWWGQALAELSLGHRYPKPWYLALFLAGAFLMRGAGCTYNDIVDKDYDARVARTAARPIPSGQVSVAEAQMFLAILCIAGFVILIQFNLFTIALGAASLVLVAIYPFMKRLTYWPQIVLGLTFKWGALVGWSAITGSLAPAPIALYAGCVLWTIGYDTIYAHQDKEDDLLVGLKSTALRLGEATPRWLTAFYTGAVLLWGLAGAMAGARLAFFLALALASIQLGWQVATLDVADPTNCLARFKSNRLVGWVLLAGLAADMALIALADAHY
jgi:4-hydroxybenzoate polyprenyltransferase